MLTGEEINVLGNIIDTSWGKSSKIEDQPASRGLKWQFVGEGQLIGTCSFIINMSAYQNIDNDKARAKGEAESIVDNAIKDIKSKFKSDAGRTLKTKEQHVDVDVELFAGIPGPGLFKFKIILGVE